MERVIFWLLLPFLAALLWGMKIWYAVEAYTNPHAPEKLTWRECWRRSMSSDI